MPRSRLGPLAIESKLGDHPASSSVWRAIHVEHQRAVAVKVFSVPFGGTPEARKEFAEEWTELKKLQHPALVRCYGGGFETTDAYLAYELIEGETLAAELERRGRLSWESVLDLAEPLVDALQYLHQRGLAHGRIQPDKIMMAGLSPVLIDIRTSRGGSPFRTGRPPTASELALQPPEAIGDPATTAAVSPRADLYALGATLYLAMTGRPPISGNTPEDVAANVPTETPPSAASLTMDCPVWFDKLITQLLQKNPAHRPPDAAAVKLALAEVRRRALSRSGVAEHTSAGFSPLNVTDQKERDEARLLLGRDLVSLDDDEVPEATAWHDQPWLLVAALVGILGLVTYLAWPLSEDAMRGRAEDLLAEETRTSLTQAKISYLRPMLERFPEGEHADWAAEQIERVEMIEAEHALSVKINRNLPLKNEAERLFAEAQRYQRFGDQATALDQYRAMVTLLGDNPQYRPFVNLARREISRIENAGGGPDEAAQLLNAKLRRADELFAEGNVVAAKRIWYSVVDLYDDNANVAPLVSRAQDRLAENASQP